jgi:hypothetical protein
VVDVIGLGDATEGNLGLLKALHPPLWQVLLAGVVLLLLDALLRGVAGGASHQR